MQAPLYTHLECQQCGQILRKLSDSEQQKVARDPYNFIFYCQQCLRDIEKNLYEKEPDLQEEDTPVV